MYYRSQIALWILIIACVGLGSAVQADEYSDTIEFYKKSTAVQPFFKNAYSVRPKVIWERCIACGKCELACAFAHGSEGKPAERVTILARYDRPADRSGTGFASYRAACVLWA